jgi:hypothetical protein
MGNMTGRMPTLGKTITEHDDATGAQRVVNVPSAHSTEIDDQPNVTYLGLAQLGALPSEPKWQIRAIIKNGAFTSVKYANGSIAYDQVWDDRAGLTYSN